ncbi:MAG: hypothetical protein QOI62_1443 [Solirubrobacteraceae bacterium]|nr:hypothetical protein [Solirubrobacteraceae bacterium]MEA2394407.1 hypothetical protein [Solirubrobacteraceae bacterium]
MTLVFSRADLPYRAPVPGAPLRLAFVGQSTFFEACALHEDTRRVVTRFIEFREGADAEAMLSTLHDFHPHAVVVFRPEIIPRGAFGDLNAATLGFLTEPIPRTAGRRAHPDLRRRRADLERLDPSNFDRVVSFDPLIVPTADEFMAVWRSLPIPVADRIYADVRRIEGPPRMLFVGRSTPHRESFLAKTKAELDVLHIAFGVAAEELEAVMAEHHVAINVHNEPYPSFENRVCLHLAAGHLVISEPLSPTHGLEPGIDYLEVSAPDDLLRIARNLARFPDAYHRVRVRGRRKAEEYRASTVWPRLVGDLFRDVVAFGTHRPAAR